ncbi:gag-pol polyprotein [Cucumis melo var. makuwa]|uniref:Gag-pol polyprotein n=1 Tax=Cucumis melo var. makuwa TaxID=1194695 RepID=A0A5A7T3V2_CUCMM|nr:gag-pol polyprotein [Cucumis melo var. makuwa]TYK22798.1 gag-pol polyprotein [Cucumis melo var. makuwa]
MEIIREGPSASRPPILNALVSGYEPPMITVNGVSKPKPEIDWTDAEGQASWKCKSHKCYLQWCRFKRIQTY